MNRVSMSMSVSMSVSLRSAHRCQLDELRDIRLRERERGERKNSKSSLRSCVDVVDGV